MARQLDLVGDLRQFAAGDLQPPVDVPGGQSPDALPGVPFRILAEALDLQRPAHARAGLVQTGGLSATDTVARNLRGIDVAVAGGTGSAEVKFPQAEPNGRYSRCVQPNWLRMTAVKEKRADGFRVEFGGPAPKDARIDWQLIR